MVAAYTHLVGDVDRLTQAALFVDVVESARLFELDEEDSISRWRAMVHHVESRVLPACGGRMVKSTGDALLLAFDSVSSAVAAAFALQHEMHHRNVN